MSRCAQLGYDELRYQAPVSQQQRPACASSWYPSVVPTLPGTDGWPIACATGRPTCCAQGTTRSGCRLRRLVDQAGDITGMRDTDVMGGLEAHKRGLRTLSHESLRLRRNVPILRGHENPCRKVLPLRARSALCQRGIGHGPLGGGHDRRGLARDVGGELVGELALL